MLFNGKFRCEVFTKENSVSMGVITTCRFNGKHLKDGGSPLKSLVIFRFRKSAEAGTIPVRFTPLFSL